MNFLDFVIISNNLYSSPRLPVLSSLLPPPLRRRLLDSRLSVPMLS